MTKKSSKKIPSKKLKSHLKIRADVFDDFKQRKETKNYLETWKSDNLPNPFDVTKQSDVTVTNAVGFQETYHVWRSTNLLTMSNLTVLIDSV